MSIAGQTVYVSSELLACHFGYRQTLARNLTHDARAIQVGTDESGLGDQASLLIEGPEAVEPIEIDDWVLVWARSEGQRDQVIFFGTVQSIGVSQQAMSGTGVQTQYQVTCASWAQKLTRTQRDIQAYLSYKIAEARTLTGATSTTKNFPTLATLVGSDGVISEPYMHVAIIFEYLSRYGSSIGQPFFMPKCMTPGSSTQYRLIDWVGKIHRTLGYVDAQHGDPDSVNVTRKLDLGNPVKSLPDSAWRLQDWQRATKYGYHYPGGLGKMGVNFSMQADPTPLTDLASQHADLPWNNLEYRIVRETNEGPKRSASLVMHDKTLAPMDWLLSVSMKPNPRPSYEWKNPRPSLEVAGLDEPVRPANIEAYDKSCAKFVIDAAYLRSMQLSRATQGVQGHFNFWSCSPKDFANKSMESMDIAMVGRMSGWIIPSIDVREISTHGLMRFMGQTNYYLDSATSKASKASIIKPLILRTYLMRAWTQGFDRMQGSLSAPIFGARQPSPGDCIIIVNPASATVGGRSVLAGNVTKVQRDLEGLGLTSPQDALIGIVDGVTLTMQVTETGTPSTQMFLQISHVLRGHVGALVPPRQLPGNHHLPVARGWNFADVGLQFVDIYLRDDADVYSALSPAKMDALKTPDAASVVPSKTQTSQQPAVTAATAPARVKSPRGTIKPPRSSRSQNPSIGVGGLSLKDS